MSSRNIFIIYAMSWNQICKSNQKILISANLFHFLKNLLSPETWRFTWLYCFNYKSQAYPIYLSLLVKFPPQRRHRFMLQRQLFKLYFKVSYFNSIPKKKKKKPVDKLFKTRALKIPLNNWMISKIQNPKSKDVIHMRILYSITFQSCFNIKVIIIF